MARPKHPNQLACIDHMAKDPDCSYAEAAKLFSVQISHVNKWVQTARQQGVVIPARTTKVGQKPVKLAPNLVMLPPPAKVLPDDLSVMARAVARQILASLRDEKDLAKVPFKDRATVLKLITDSYELLPSVEGKTTATGAKPSASLTAALMGSLPDDPDEDTEEDPIAVLTSLAGTS